MTTSLMPGARQRYWNNDGTLAAGCLLYTYAAGTTTPKATFQDSEGLVQHSNPIELDAKGEAVVYWNGAYKVDLKTAAGVQITGYPVDNYTPPTDTLRTALATSTGASLVGWIASAAGSVARWVQDKLRSLEVSTADYGTLTDAFFAAAGKTLTFDADYTSTVSLVLPANTTLDLQGHTLTFNVTGATNCLDLRSWTIVKNGSVVLAGSAYTGHGGNGCPIVVGDYGTGSGYSDIVIDGVTITSNKSDGNGVFITGDSHNVELRNLNFTSSSTLGRPVCVHWGNANDAASGTYHPYNITIDGVDINDQTYDSTANGAVFLSGVYNITVRNVRAGACTDFALVRVFCGDYGFTYAPSNVAANGMCGVLIEGCTAEQVKHLFQGTMRDTDGSVTLWPSKITLRNVSGAGDTASDSARRAFQVELLNDLVIEDCTASGFYDGVLLGSTVHRLNVMRNKFLSMYRSPVYMVSTGSPDFEDIKLIENYCKDSNTGNAAGQADFNLSMASSIDVDGNIFDSPLCDWNVRAQSGANAPSNIVCENNISRNVKASAGPAFSFGGSTDFSILKVFFNNTVVNVPTSGVVSGQVHKPFLIAPGGNAAAAQQKWMTYTGAPASGTWNVGDTVWNASPTAGGNIGWVCVTAGTPGTWKSFGVITA